MRLSQGKFFGKSGTACAKPRKRGTHNAAAASGDAVTAPMQGTVVKVAVEEGHEATLANLQEGLSKLRTEFGLRDRTMGWYDTVLWLIFQVVAYQRLGRHIADTRD